MAIKMTMADGTVIEGTVEELAELQRLANNESEDDEQAESKPKYKTEDRAAKIGERILITDAVIDEPYENGDVFTVAEEDYICVGDVKVEETERWVGRSEYEVIIEEESDPRLKFEGVEKVRLISGGDRGMLQGFKDGDICEVIEVFERYSHLLRIRSERSGTVGYAYPSQLEIYAEPKFSVGDYAKVIGETKYGDIDEGTYVKVTDDDDYDDGHIRIDLIDESDFDLAKPEALEKVELTDGDLSFIRAGREPGETINGDLVRVKDACGAPLKEGEIYEVGSPSNSRFSTIVTDEGWFVTVSELVAPASARVDIDA